MSTLLDGWYAPQNNLIISVSNIDGKCWEIPDKVGSGFFGKIIYKSEVTYWK